MGPYECNTCALSYICSSAEIDSESTFLTRLNYSTELIIKYWADTTSQLSSVIFNTQSDSKKAGGGIQVHRSKISPVHF